MNCLIFLFCELYSFAFSEAATLLYELSIMASVGISSMLLLMFIFYGFTVFVFEFAFVLSLLSVFVFMFGISLSE